jgi:hypothetical protein
MAVGTLIKIRLKYPQSKEISLITDKDINIKVNKRGEIKGLKMFDECMCFIR